LLTRCIVGYPLFSIGFDTILEQDNNNKKRNDRKFFVGAEKPVSVIYVEVYVNPTAAGKEHRPTKSSINKY
jgi:hypothetical protein